MDVRVLREFSNTTECRRESIGLILTEERRMSFKENMVGGESRFGDTDGLSSAILNGQAEGKI